MTTICAIDNGVTGGITILHPDKSVFYSTTPVKKVKNYTKVEAHLHRIDTKKLETILCKLPKDTMVFIERPMINPGRFKASISAVRALEATLIVLEDLNLKYRYVDSKEWQSYMLPDIVGSEELKKASLAKGKELYPDLEYDKDADSLLLALWVKETNQNLCQ